MRLYFVFSASSSTLSPFFLLPNTAMFQCHVKSCHINKTLLNIPITVTVKIIIHGFVGPHGLQPTRVLCPWDSPGKNTGVGCHALLQEIFLTKGWNPGLPHSRWILYRLSHILIHSLQSPPALNSLLLCAWFPCCLESILCLCQSTFLTS